MHGKYILPQTIEDWIRNIVKWTPNSSVIWKEIVVVFNIEGSSLAWEVKNGEKLQIGLEP